MTKKQSNAMIIVSAVVMMVGIFISIGGIMKFNDIPKEAQTGLNMFAYTQGGLLTFIIGAGQLIVSIKARKKHSITDKFEQVVADVTHYVRLPQEEETKSSDGQNFDIYRVDLEYEDFDFTIIKYEHPTGVPFPEKMEIRFDRENPSLFEVNVMPEGVEPLFTYQTF